MRASLDADAVISVEGHEEKLDQLSAFLKKDGLKVELRRGDARDPARGVVTGLFFTKDIMEASITTFLSLRKGSIDFLNIVFCRRKVNKVGEISDLK